MVTICTTSLTFNNSTFCPHTVFMCFVWISQQTAIISLYNINWLVFITETESVYCAVRTECLNVIEANLGANAPHTSSSTCCCYQKDKRSNPRNLPKAMLFRKSTYVKKDSTGTWRRLKGQHPASLYLQPTNRSWCQDSRLYKYRRWRHTAPDSHLIVASLWLRQTDTRSFSGFGSIHRKTRDCIKHLPES